MQKTLTFASIDPATEFFMINFMSFVQVANGLFGQKDVTFEHKELGEEKEYPEWKEIKISGRRFYRHKATNRLTMYP